MKKLYKLISILLLLLIIIVTYTACSKDDSSDGKAKISYIRVTDPAKSDSLLVKASQGSMIAIIGENLQDAQEIWFNDLKAALTSTLVTSTSIIVKIPSNAPEVVDNKLKIVFSNKDTLKYDFVVAINAPKLESMDCEYVADGGTAVLRGNYFYEPLTVTFPGGVEGIVSSVEAEKIEVIVPAGAQPGQIKVNTNFGSATSSFHFRDTRNIILDFDNLTAAGSWQPGKLSNSEPNPISGNFARFKGEVNGSYSGWPDETNLGLYMWPKQNGRGDVPLYTGNIANAALKFELNVVDNWTAGALTIIFTTYAETETGNNAFLYTNSNLPRALYKPWETTGGYKTNGWTTVTIPLTDVKYTRTGTLSDIAFTADRLKGINFIVYWGGVNGTTCTTNICMDNVRIVPLN